LEKSEGCPEEPPLRADEHRYTLGAGGGELRVADKKKSPNVRSIVGYI